MLLVVSLIWFLILFLRQSFPPLFGAFKQEFGVSNTETGFLFSALMFTYSVMQFPSGILSDQVGSHQVILLGILIVSVGAFVFAVSPTFTLLAVAAVIIGAGSGMHKTVVIGLISLRYPEQRGSALGTLDTIGQFGGVAAPATIVLLQQLSVPWSGLFIISGGVGIALAFLVYVSDQQSADHQQTDTASVDEPADTTDDEGQIREVETIEYLHLLGDAHLLLFVIVISMTTFIWNAISAFLPLYLMTSKGLDAATAGLTYSVFFLVSFSQLVTGRLSDRADRLLLSAALLMIGTLTLGALLGATSTTVIIGLVAVLGLSFHGFRPVRDSYLTHIIPDAIVGGSLGIVRTIMTGMGSTGPVVVGYLSDAFGFVTALTVLTGLLGACLLMLLSLKLLQQLAAPSLVRT
ncbi:MFS transporter [Halomarina halobia]|uniref:MFS transporter n=1 Tax=Halomarina halobia TaxID=3033386 RepID=A0ABD6AEP1_9EURY|nr:MFS transporter [Halomarina sp. PSR21]